MKQWKFKKICLRSKKWRTSVARNRDGHPSLKVIVWENGSLERFIWKTKGEKLQLQEIVMDTGKQLHERMEVHKDLLEKQKMRKYEDLELWNNKTLEKVKQKWGVPKEFMIDTHNHKE